MQNNRSVGSRYEEMAASYLRSLGCRILRQNYRCPLGEIDLIVRDGETLVFAEVKYRYDNAYGVGQFHVDRRKQQHIIRVAEWYLTELGTTDILCRFDVIAVDGEDRIEHFQNAFEKTF